MLLKCLQIPFITGLKFRCFVTHVANEGEVALAQGQHVLGNVFTALKVVATNRNTRIFRYRGTPTHDVRALFLQLSQLPFIRTVVAIAQ